APLGSAEQARVETLWPVRAIFRVVGTDEQVCQPATKSQASRDAPVAASPDDPYTPMADAMLAQARVPDTTGSAPPPPANSSAKIAQECAHAPASRATLA